MMFAGDYLSRYEQTAKSEGTLGIESLLVFLFFPNRELGLDPVV